MSNVIRVPENYASNRVYAQVKEAAQILGEEVIALVMFHPGVNDEGVPRCVCYDEDYNETSQYDCGLCFGTTYSGGVKEAWRVWTIWDDDENPLDRGRNTGIYDPHTYTVQAEPWPNFYETDYLVRVKQWDGIKQAPLVFEQRYRITKAEQLSVRTGNRYGVSNADQIAQLLQVSALPESEPIYKYDIVENVSFPRQDSQAR